MPDFLELRRNLATCVIETDEGPITVEYRPGIMRSPKAMRLSNMGDRLEQAEARNDSEDAIALFDELVAFLPRTVVTWTLPEYPGGPVLDPHSDDLYYQGYDVLGGIFMALIQEAGRGPKSNPESLPRPLPGSGGARKRTHR